MSINNSCCINDCNDVNICVNRELIDIGSGLTPANLVDFCAAVVKCVDAQFDLISQGLDNNLPHYIPSIEYYLRSLPGYTDEGDIFLSLSDNVFTWQEGVGGSSYTDEQAQDAVGLILVNSASVTFNYNDALPSISATVVPAYVRGLFGAGPGLTYNSSTGVFTNSGAVYTDEQAQDAVGYILGPEFLYDDATPSITLNAANGLSLGASYVGLGQTIGAVGNPAVLLADTEVPLADYSLIFNNKSGTGTDVASVAFNIGNSGGSNEAIVTFTATDHTAIKMVVDDITGNLETLYYGFGETLLGSSGYSLLGAGGSFYLSNMVGSTTHSAVQVGGSDSQVWKVTGDTNIGLFGTKNTGFGGITTPTANVDIAASTLTNIPLRIQPGVDPSSNFLNGSIWHTNNHLYGRLNGVTKQLDNDYNFTPDDFIQNQDLGPQPLAKFWVDGFGIIDDYLQISDAGRFVTDISGIISVTNISSSLQGSDLRARRLTFFTDIAPYDAIVNSNVYIGAITGSQMILSAGGSVQIQAPAIEFNTIGSTSPIITAGGLYPIHVAGNDGAVGAYTYFDVWNNNMANTVEVLNTRAAFSINLVNGSPLDPFVNRGTRMEMGRVGIEALDNTALGYMADLVFETVDATVNTGLPTEQLRIKYDGRVIVQTLDTDNVAPVTSGTTKMVICDEDGLLSFDDIPAVSSSGALSSLTAAIATNSINNNDYLQTWSWNSLTSTAFSLSSTSTAASAGQTLLSIALSGANASAGRTTYAASLINQHSGTTSTNVGILAQSTTGVTCYGGQFIASGALTNIGLQATASGGASNIGLSVTGSISGSGGTMVYTPATTTGTGSTVITGAGFVVNAASLTTGEAVHLTSASITSGTMLRLNLPAGSPINGQKGIYLTSSGINSANVTTYGIYSENIKTGTNSVNIAGYFSASGGITNYAIQVPAGDIRVDSFSNSSSQNRLVGQISSTGVLGYVTVGTGLSLAGGVLTATGAGGSDTNFAISNLTATASRSHDWANFDLSIINLDDLTLQAVTSVTIDSDNIILPSITNVATQDQILGQDSGTGQIGFITIGSGLTLAAGVLDSIASGGTVTSFSAGDLSPLFTTSEATVTTTPALTFALTSAAANTWFGRNVGSIGAPAYNSAGSVTKVDDTNVTLTLGGTPTNSVLNAFSLTLGWTGTLGVARGGTNIASYTTGDITIATGATTLSKIAIGSAGQLLRVTGTTLEYFTPTYISAAITTLNTLTAATQTFATGTSGTDFNISSSVSTHTFNIPSASTTNRGLVTTSAQTLGDGIKTFNVGVVINESGAASDFRVESDTNANALFVDATNNRVGIFTAAPAHPLDITGNTRILSGTLAIGTAPSNAAPLTLGGSGYTSSGLILLPSISAAVGSSPSIVGITGTIIEAGSGTHTIISALNVSAPTITAGAATTTDAATVYINGPTAATVTGGNNHALLIGSGLSRFNGDVIISNNVYSTGGYSLQVRNTSSGRLETIEPDVVTLNSQSGTAYTLALSDKGGMVRMSNASANTLTIPSNASVAFTVGTQIILYQEGAGQTTISPAVGVTINSADAALKTRAQHSVSTLIKIATNTWVLSGDITAV